MSWLRRLLGGDPVDATGWHALGHRHLKASVVRAKPELVDKAIGAFERAVELDRDHEDAWFQIGYLYGIHKRNHAKAMEAHRQLIRLGPGNPAAWRDLASDHQALGQYRDAVTAAREAIRLHPSAISWEHLGHIYALQGDRTALPEIHEELMKLDRSKAALFRKQYRVVE